MQTKGSTFRNLMQAQVSAACFSQDPQHRLCIACHGIFWSCAVKPDSAAWGLNEGVAVELLEGVSGIGVLNSHPDPLVTPKFHQCHQFQAKQSNHLDLPPKLTFSHRWSNTAHVLWCRFVSSLTDIWVNAIRKFWTQHPRTCPDFQEQILLKVCLLLYK